MQRNRLGLDTVLTGVVLQIAGLAVDILLHSRQPHLALEEHVLTLTHPAHAFFVLGFVLTIAGVGLLLLAAQGTLTRRGLLLRTVPLTLVGVLAPIAFFLAFRTVSDGAERDRTPLHLLEVRNVSYTSTADTHREPVRAGAVPVHVNPQSNNRHEHGSEVTVSYTRRLTGSWEPVGVMSLTPPGPTSRGVLATWN